MTSPGVDNYVTKYKVSGMHCLSCAMLIENQLEDTGAADEAICEYTSSELTLKSHQQINANTVLTTIEKLGYTATPIV